MVKVLYDCQTPFGEGGSDDLKLNTDTWSVRVFQSPRGEGVVQTRCLACQNKRTGGSFNHLAVRGWFRQNNLCRKKDENGSFNHLAVRGWFRLAVIK